MNHAVPHNGVYRRLHSYSAKAALQRFNALVVPVGRPTGKVLRAGIEMLNDRSRRVGRPDVGLSLR